MGELSHKILSWFGRYVNSGQDRYPFQSSYELRRRTDLGGRPSSRM